MSKNQWLFIWEWSSCRNYNLTEATKIAQKVIKEGNELTYQTMDKQTWSFE